MSKENKEDLQRKVSDEIRAILEANNMALAPILQYSPTGIIPGVRLVDLTKSNETTGDTRESSGDSKEDGTTKD